MTGRNKNQAQKGRRKTTQQVDHHQQLIKQSGRQPDQQTIISSTSTHSSQSTQSQATQAAAQPDESVASNATQAQQRANKDLPLVKRIIKAEIDESRTLNHVFKSNPDTQMRDFIKKAAKPNQAPVAKVLPKTPADAHPPAVAQELLETDDDVADNLGKLFKASKSYKNL